MQYTFLFYRHRYTNESTDQVKLLDIHNKACRDVEMDEDGKVLYSTSKDKSIIVTDMNTLKTKKVIPDAHR